MISQSLSESCETKSRASAPERAALEHFAQFADLIFIRVFSVSQVTSDTSDSRSFTAGQASRCPEVTLGEVSGVAYWLWM